MAKSKPIGVRFNEDLLNKLIESGVVSSAQKALILYERAFLQNQTVADYFHKPTSFQAPINFAGLKGTDTSKLKIKERQYPLTPQDCFNKEPRGEKESIIDYKIRIAQK